jgi:hypothetical protein
MAGPGNKNYDDIIRQAIGMQAPVAADAPLSPPEGSSLGQTFMDLLAKALQGPPGIAEGEMAPIDRWREMTERKLGPAQRLPYIADPNRGYSGPTLIPLNDRDMLDPKAPLQRGESWSGKLEL